MRILTVDDEPGVLRVLRIYLESFGFEVESCSSGEEALERFDAGETPIVITDWTMPGMDGLELIRAIRARPGGQYVYALLITGRSGRGDIVTGMEAGADDFIAKPFDRDELRVRVREGERIVRLERALLGEIGAAGSFAAPDASAILARVADGLEDRLGRLSQMLLETAQRRPVVGDRCALMLALVGELRHDIELLRGMGEANGRPPAHDARM